MKKTKLALFLAIMFLSSLLISYSPLIAFSEESNEKYTSVISDLQKDENFNADDFEFIQNDYSLQVIQIAESNRKELFVYVYQPSASTQATSINISLNLHDELSFENYKLQLLSKTGVFQKYIVEELSVLPQPVRYYEISSIFRAWNENYDDFAGGNNTVSEVSYEVGKLFTIIEDEGITLISAVDVEVITVTDKYIGFVRYDDGNIGSPGLGLSFAIPGYDSHFVAFSTDKPLERLYEADLYFQSQKYGYNRRTFFGITVGENESFGEAQENYVQISHTDYVNLEVPHGIGLGSSYYRSYDFERIQTVNEFIEVEDREWVYSGVLLNAKTQSKITDDGLIELNNKQWVLRFAETQYQDGTVPLGFMSESYIAEYSLVSDVTILRLKFESDGIVYNLGVIDNKQTGDGQPVNEFKTIITPSTLLKIIIALLILLIIAPLLGVFKSIIEIILLPFSIFKKKE